MSASDYSHRPRFPAVEEILSDFDSSKNRTRIDPSFVVEDDGKEIVARFDEVEDKDKNSSLTKEEQQRKKDILATYNKVAEFLEQNENLNKSVDSMNELSKELHMKKENLIQLITNIKQNMNDSKKT